MNGEAAGARRAGFSLTTHCEAGDRREVTFEIADLKLAASAITFNLRPDHAPQDANSTSRVWAISAAVSVTAPVTAEATKIGPSAFLVWWRCVSSCDVLDLLGYILVAVFQRRLVLDHRFASGR
jgi:hypothetical protein